jgi:hypothetical protein
MQELRYNVNDVTTTQNGVDRYNAFVFLNHEFDGGLEMFAEAGGYLANSVGYREQAPMLGAVPIVIPATNYYNPFGPTGSPNRLAGTNAPAGGLGDFAGRLSPRRCWRAQDARGEPVGPCAARPSWRLCRLGLGICDPLLAGQYRGQRKPHLQHAVPGRRSRGRRRMRTILSMAAASAVWPVGDCTPTSAATIKAISRWMCSGATRHRLRRGT